MTEDEMGMIVSQVMDDNLKHTLQFGIGLHHAGLNDRDRSLVEELFTNTKIQVRHCILHKHFIYHKHWSNQSIAVHADLHQHRTCDQLDLGSEEF